MLLLTVFKQDTKCIISDCVGVYVVPCKDIPRLGTDAEQRATTLEVDAPQRKIFRLPLFHLAILVGLESRAGLNDSKAK